MIELLFWLLAGHALADFALQSDFTAKGKNRHTKPFNVPLGQTPQIIWPWILGAHALIHGGMVALVTESFELGIAETIVHAIIDAAKCENLTGIHTDQFLHIACKILWALLLMQSLGF